MRQNFKPVPKESSRPLTLLEMNTPLTAVLGFAAAEHTGRSVDSKSDSV